MSWLTTTITELYGLFVDDVPFAAAIVAWLLAIAALVRFLPSTTGWAGLALAAGLLLLLVESATRSARKHPTRK